MAAVNQFKTLFVCILKTQRFIHFFYNNKKIKSIQFNLILAASNQPSAQLLHPLCIRPQDMDCLVLLERDDSELIEQRPHSTAELVCSVRVNHLCEDALEADGCSSNIIIIDKAAARRHGGTLLLLLHLNDRPRDHASADERQLLVCGAAGRLGRET